MENKIIGFLGGGNMAASLISGLRDSGFNPANIWVVDRNEKRREHLATDLKVQVESNAKEVVKKSDVIVLAVKPNDMEALCLDIKDAVQEKKPLIVSIAAGIQTHHYTEWFKTPIPIVRAMPNTPCILRCGATGLYANPKVTEEDKSLTESLLRTVGITVWVDHEHDIDTITALSGSGPAYFFLIMEALEQGAVSLGLSKKVANLLTLQTALGAARMALESEISLEALKNKVAAKGGTTESALNVLETNGIRELMSNVLKAAKERSVEISHLFDMQKT